MRLLKVLAVLAAAVAVGLTAAAPAQAADITRCGPQAGDDGGDVTLRACVQFSGSADAGTVRGTADVVDVVPGHSVPTGHVEVYDSGTGTWTDLGYCSFLEARCPIGFDNVRVTGDGWVRTRVTVGRYDWNTGTYVVLFVTRSPRVYY